MAPQIQDRFKAKNKHVTIAYNQLLSDVLLMFDTPNGFKEQIGVQRVSGPVENTAEASNMELLNSFYTDLVFLKNSDMSANYNRQNNYNKTTQLLEDVETRMSTVVSELERRCGAFKASTGYNRTDGRFYEYVTNILDQYKDVQNVMEKIEEPFQSVNEVNAANGHETEYLNAEEAFTGAVLAYNKMVDSPAFNADLLPDAVKEKLNGADFTPESLVDKADLDSMILVMNQELNTLTSSIEAAEQIRDGQINNKRKEFKANADKRADDVKAAIKKEDERFDKYLQGMEEEAEPFIKKIQEKRPEEAEKQYKDNLETFGRNDYSKVRNEYKVSVEDINREMSFEELAFLEKKVEEQLGSLDSRSNIIKNELERNESDKEDLEKSWNAFKDLNTVEDSEKYQQLTALEEEKQKPIDEISSKIDELSISGLDVITSEFLKENKIDLKIPENKERSRAISKGNKAIYDAIGRGTITRRWTEDGKDLNVAVNNIYNVFVSDFQELGWENLLFGNAFTEDDLNNLDDLDALDAEQKESDDVTKPFEMTEELKNDYFNISKLIIDAFGETDGLTTFGYFTSDTSPREALVTSKLVERREDLAKFAESINPLSEGNEQKRQKLNNIKNSVQEAVLALEKIAQNQQVMEGLQKVSDAMQLSEEELDFKKQVQTALETQREELQKQKDEVTEEKNRWVDGFDSSKSSARVQVLANEVGRNRFHDEQEQIKLDVDHLTLAKSIITERKNQAKLKAEQVDAQEKINTQKEQVEEEKERITAAKEDIKKRYQEDIQKMGTETNKELAKISLENGKVLAEKKQKKEVLSNFAEKVTRLNNTKNELKRWAEEVGRDHHALINNKAIGIRRLGEQHQESLRKMDGREKTIYDNMAKTKRWRSNSAEYDRMMTSMKAYLDLKPENPNIHMTRDEYQTLVSNARRDINAYISLRDRNNGVKRTDIGQQRLDGAYNFLKLLEKREAMITHYHSNVEDIERIYANRIQTKTRAEEVILGKQEIQPDHEASREIAGHTFNIVGNPAVKEEFSNIAKSYLESSPLLINKLNTAIDSLAAGNGRALGEIVAITVTLQMGQCRKMKGRPQLTDEKANDYVKLLQDTDVVKNIVNQTLNGNIKCSDIFGEVRSEEFNNGLTEELNRRKKPAPREEEVKKDTKIFDKEEKGIEVKNQGILNAH